MPFKYLITTVRGYSRDPSQEANIDTIHVQLPLVERAKILKAIGFEEGVEECTVLTTGMYSGIQGWINHIRDKETKYDAVLIFATDNSELNNKRDLLCMLDFTCSELVPTVLVRMTDDGKVKEILQQNQHPGNKEHFFTTMAL